MHLHARWLVGVYDSCVYLGDTPSWKRRKGQQTNSKPTEPGYQGKRHEGFGMVHVKVPKRGRAVALSVFAGGHY